MPLLLKVCQYFCEKSPSFLLGVCYNLAICEHTGLECGLHVVSPDAICHRNYQKTKSKKLLGILVDGDVRESNICMALFLLRVFTP